MKKKVESISMDEWLEAETKLSILRAQPKPPGSVTPEEYGKQTNRSVAHARSILNKMREAGLATREKWCSGISTRYVYTLKKLH